MCLLLAVCCSLFVVVFLLVDCCVFVALCLLFVSDC